MHVVMLGTAGCAKRLSRVGMLALLAVMVLAAGPSHARPLVPAPSLGAATQNLVPIAAQSKKAKAAAAKRPVKKASTKASSKKAGISKTGARRSTAKAASRKSSKPAPRLSARGRAKGDVARDETGASPTLTRAQILAADSDALARLGRHIVIGSHSTEAVRKLVERRAIAGFFLTQHNVRRRKPEVIKAEIDALQALRRSQGEPPLIVAADQEGGFVSRMSPPLRRQPTLASEIAKANDEADLKARVEAYAGVKAEELSRLGVTLNFAPVVDLKLDPRRRTDGETRLRLRALSEDPQIVAKVAGWYCDVLAARGIMCTLKHFPGLGTVTVDTHRVAGEAKASKAELAARDWLPFQALVQKPHVVTMLAHARLPEIDQDNPASYSQAIIQGVVRGQLGAQGLLITDDLSMGAVTRSADGVGGAAVKALTAGADLILVSFSEKHLNAVMTSLIEADASGVFDLEARKASAHRLRTSFLAQRAAPVTHPSATAP